MKLKYIPYLSSDYVNRLTQTIQVCVSGHQGAKILRMMATNSMPDAGQKLRLIPPMTFRGIPSVGNVAVEVP